MAGKNDSKAVLMAAVIAALGGIAVAVINNWKPDSSSSQQTPSSSTSQASVPSVIAIEPTPQGKHLVAAPDELKGEAKSFPAPIGPGKPTIESVVIGDQKTSEGVVSFSGGPFTPMTKLWVRVQFAQSGATDGQQHYFKGELITADDQIVETAREELYPWVGSDSLRLSFRRKDGWERGRYTMKLYLDEGNLIAIRAFEIP
ncbi:hypothetical protein ACPPVV_00560 [Rhodanobacter sp. Col0626]|uniref:hypothetical protein n=1 Tax=Rhodanobacter sp. Col0626 TaxID=3415679 RepID=UPI003CF339C4